MFKIALTAGHYLYTPGKRCMKELDPGETREWWLNDRIADKIETLLQGYTGYELLRTDDTNGQKDISLAARANAANNWKADFYLSIHHNAGINGGKGGGIVAYIYTKASPESAQWQKALYDALIAATGLKGNRSSPLAKANYYECRETNMPAVLLELGFMDSQTDVPVILTEEHADKCARAIVEVLVRRGGLKPKEEEPETVTLTLPVLSRGSEGKAVRALQSLLVGAGEPLPKYGIDGDFGTETQTALKSYQQAKGIAASGSADAPAWKSLLGV